MVAHGPRSRKALTFVVGILVLSCAGCGFVRTEPAPQGPIAPLSHAGRWFTDVRGRVVMLRGTNFVQKAPPFEPGGVGFDDDDAALLAARGFNTVRLGVVFEALMPEPGRVEHAYVDRIAETARVLARHGVFVLLDFHQDGWGPATHGNGMPEWATLTDGLPNPPVGFPLYYIQNPALQRAFDNFWANRNGPDGIPLQEHYAEGLQAVASRFAAMPNVLGYEAMNEPWPGTDWVACLTGCPALEQQRLTPFYARMAAAVRAVDPRHPLFVEPFPLFNFGSAATSLPGDTPRQVLATHVYAGSEQGDLAVMDNSIAAATGDGVAVLATEWGATNDPALITRTADQFDSRLLPWLFWAYNENIIVDTQRPPTPDNVRTDVLDALTRPYPSVVNGTPTHLHFDAGTGALDFAYDAQRPDGRTAAPGLETVVTVPPPRYADGYTASVLGATITSPPCAPSLTLRNLPHAQTVSVHIEPASCR
jgi:endoglycosylceramidase